MKRKEKEKQKKDKPIEKLQKEIAGYGFSYSLKDFYKTLALFFFALIAIGILFQLKPMYILMLCIIGVLVLPIVIKGQYKYLYEQKRFSDVSTYIEQMIYNFKRTPKILNDLVETNKIFENGKMSSCIEQAIQSIENGEEFEKALESIEQKYECSHIRSLHRFLKKVEQTGGSYLSGLNILFEDHGAWIQRVYKYQKDRKASKHTVVMAMVFSTFILLFFTYIMPSEYLNKVISNDIYQIAITSVLVISYLIYVILVTKLNGSWLVNDVASDKLIREKYSYMKTYEPSNNRKKGFKKCMILLPLLLIGALLQNIYVIMLTVFFMIVVYRQPSVRYKSSIKFISNEIQNSISDWLRDLIIDIPNNNVRISIENSIETAPFVMQDELRDLINNIDESPMSIRPYQSFFKELNVPEIKRPVQMLYALTELGTEDTESQLNELIKQNNVLMASDEDLRNEQSSSGIHLMHLIPAGVSGLALGCILFIFLIVIIGDLGSRL